MNSESRSQNPESSPLSNKQLPRTLSENNIEKHPARTFQDLIVWQKAHQFVLKIYEFTDKFPKEENYGLTSQLRRAAISIPSILASGF